MELSIAAGERVLVTGPSGAGKSTLLRAIAGLLTDGEGGEMAGAVRIGSSLQPGGLGRQVGPLTGLLLQNPTAGVIAETVGRDVAFGLENQAVAPTEIWPQVDAALHAVRFPYDRAHPTAALSGGEMQRLTLAGTLALGAPVLLLDEPTSMLDPTAAADIRAALQEAIRARSCTTVIVEHHLEPWIDFVHRLVVLNNDGQVVAAGDPAAVLDSQAEALTASGVWVPGAGAPPLLDVNGVLTAPARQCPTDVVWADEVVVELARRSGGRPAAVTRALDGVSARLNAGTITALTGASGAGKSTLAAVLAGLQRPTGGRVYAAASLSTGDGAEPWRWRSRDLADRLAWVPQLPEHGVVTSSVLDEVLATSRACGRGVAASRARAFDVLDVLSLTDLTDASPYHLSGGEQRRLMLAAALVHGPCGVVLDEPTVGQDRHTWAAVLGTVAALRESGVAVGLSTHDELAVATLADSVLRLDFGRAAA